MKYQVIIELGAAIEIYNCVEFLKRVSADAAQKLYAEIMDAIYSLVEMPHRYPVDPAYCVLEQEERKIVLGNGRYIALYTIESDSVHIEWFCDVRKQK